MDCNSSSTSLSLSIPQSFFDGVKALTGSISSGITDVLQAIEDAKTVENVKTGIETVSEKVTELTQDVNKIISDVNTLISWMNNTPAPPPPPKPFDKTTQAYTDWSEWLTLFFPMLNGIIYDTITYSANLAGISATAESYLTMAVGCQQITDDRIADAVSNFKTLSAYGDSQFNQITAIKNDYNSYKIENPALLVFLEQFINPSTAGQSVSSSESTSAIFSFPYYMSSVLPLLDAIQADVDTTHAAVNAANPTVDTTAAAANVANAVSAASIPSPAGLGQAAQTAAVSSSGGMPALVNAIKKPTDFVSIAMYGNTADNALVYTGTDSVVWDRINNERLRRKLTSLTDEGTPRPT